MPPITGVYKITCLTTGMVYVGSAVNIRDRWKKHIRDLKKQRHHSPHLQSAWNLYGQGNFEFAMIEENIPSSDLIPREQYWIDRLRACDRNSGYNVSPTAGSTLGKNHTEATRRKMSELKKGKTPYGAQAPTAKLTDEQVLQIKARLAQGETARDAAKIFNVSRQTVDYIKSGKYWSHVVYSDLTPEQLASIPVRQLGTEKWNAKLTESDVFSIKHRLRRGEVIAQIAREYGVAAATISKINLGLTWKHVVI